MPFLQVCGRMRTKRAKTGCGTRFRTTSAGSVLAWKICNSKVKQEARLVTVRWRCTVHSCMAAPSYLFSPHTLTPTPHPPTEPALAWLHTQWQAGQSRDNPNMDPMSPAQLSMCFGVKGSARGGWESLTMDGGFSSTSLYIPPYWWSWKLWET